MNYEKGIPTTLRERDVTRELLEQLKIMEFCKDLTTKYGGQSWKQAIDRFKKGQKEKPPDTPLGSISI